ncbi:YisL family protein [Thalassobacillus sp. CUG 92003]|uniref:YisL family protein n=1 Tax=Thalassobacillus sp. CUG 92003 TaxID=2736641 RepID=UPI0015E76801|nr:YisL family protein [Thalassobacillus sp. CUG 92003]
MAHLHIASWVLALALVGMVTTFARSKNRKATKITHIILRVVFLLILYSGGSLFASYENYDGLIILKLLVGLWAIAAMEIATVKYVKQKPAVVWWVQLLIAVSLALLLGFGFLPMGVLP